MFEDVRLSISLWLFEGGFHVLSNQSPFYLQLAFGPDSIMETKARGVGADEG